MESTQNNELRHYGVLGMKWGVRRASRQLSKATSDEARKKAVATLEKHRTKATNKLSKLSKQHDKLEKKIDDRTIKADLKAKQMKNKAAKARSKAGRLFVTNKMRERLISKSMSLDVKADAILAKSESYKAKFERNETLQKRFNQGLDSIDKALVDYGRKAVHGK